jgi:hypothetical protein
VKERTADAAEENGTQKGSPLATTFHEYFVPGRRFTGV